MENRAAHLWAALQPAEDSANMRRPALVFIAAVMASSSGHGEGLDDASRAQIDHSVLGILERTGTPSASIAVIKDGKIE